MKRYLSTILFIVSAAAILSACSETEQISPSYYGTWVIKDFQWAKVSALSTDEAEAFRGYTITYQTDAVIQNDQKISIDGYHCETEPYTEELLVQDYRANLGEWWNGIEAVSLVSVVTTEEFLGNQFFVVDQDTLWIFCDGVFFIAKKE